ncbi:hypothetical protein VTK73DRAFT_5392 [Phialemonium thermophilum]|uniref:YTH domain-containing protein n=1 Tax=Phialemonium thermophilum TaxID=223376 RepID=A0ABR3XYF7_9PEZI
MSSPSTHSQTSSSKIKVDARAAELKERLLKSRNQKNSRPGSLEPQVEKARSPVATSEPSTAAVAMAVLVDPSQQSGSASRVPANSDDIAALISSISSTSPGVSFDSAPTLGPPVSADELERESRAQNNEAEKPVLVTGGPPQVPTGLTSLGAPVRPTAVPAEPLPTLFSADSDLTHVTNGDCSQPSLSRLDAVTQEPVGIIEQSVHVMGTPKLKISTTGQDGPSMSTETKIAQSSASSQTKAAQGRGENAPSNSVTTEMPGADVDNAGNRMASKEPRADKKFQSDAGVSTQAERSRLLARLLEIDADLKDWLHLTQYHDVELRTRKLTRYRKLAEVDAKQRQIEAEQQRLAAERQKLLEEEDLERRMEQYLAVPALAPPATPLIVPDVNSVLAVKISNFDNTPSNEREATQDSHPSSFQAKRANPYNDPSSRPAKVTRRESGEAGIEQRVSVDESKKSTGCLHHIDSRPTMQPNGPEKQRDDSGHNTLPVRNVSIASLSSPTLNYRQESPSRSRQSPSRCGYSPRYLPHPASPNRFGGMARGNRSQSPHNDGHWGSGHREAGRRSPSPLPKHRKSGSAGLIRSVDLGKKGESRFFMVKSFNEDNVRRCFEDGIWTTQVQNGEILASAFASCKNVILFFSINKSRAFQGYARMATAPSPDTPRPYWMNGIHWATSDPFRVEWICTTEVEFYHIGHLKNKLNENQAVLVGRDGQEIDEECGRNLAAEMDSVAKIKREMRRLEMSPGLDIRKPRRTVKKYTNKHHAGDR